MLSAPREMGLRDYGRVVLRRKWIVVAAVVTALLGSVLMSLLQDPIYEAEAQMLVEPRSSETVFQQDPTLNVQNLERAIQTEIQVLEGQRVRARCSPTWDCPTSRLRWTAMRSGRPMSSR